VDVFSIQDEVSQIKLNPLKARAGDRWLWTVPRRYQAGRSAMLAKKWASSISACGRCYERNFRMSNGPKPTRPKEPARDDEEQSKRFIEAAKEAGADETEEGADRAFKESHGKNEKSQMTPCDGRLHGNLG
jgi:hypothetical protein